jgi:hypothetical protein
MTEPEMTPYDNFMNSKGLEIVFSSCASNSVDPQHINELLVHHRISAVECKFLLAMQIDDERIDVEGRRNYWLSVLALSTVVAQLIQFVAFILDVNGPVVLWLNIFYSSGIGMTALQGLSACCAYLISQEDNKAIPKQKLLRILQHLEIKQLLGNQN